MRRAWLQVAGLVRSAADIRLPSLLYGVSVTAPLPSGELLAIDTSAAETCPGVVCVPTADSALSGKLDAVCSAAASCFFADTSRWPDRGAGGGGFSIGGARRCPKINLRVREPVGSSDDWAALSADATGSLCAVSPGPPRMHLRSRRRALCRHIDWRRAWRAGRVTVSRPQCGETAG